MYADVNKEITTQWLRVPLATAEPFSFAPAKEAVHDVLVLQPFAFAAESALPAGRIIATVALPLSAVTCFHLPLPATNEGFVPVVNVNGMRWRLNATPGMVPFYPYNNASILPGNLLEIWSVGAAGACLLTAPWTLTLGTRGGTTQNISVAQVSPTFIFN